MKQLLAFILFIPLLSNAQFEVVPSNHIPVKRADNSTIRNPWTGGINAAELSMFDADFDGIEDDIFIFDKAGDRILIFLGSTQGGQRVYTYTPHLANQFPDLKNWALLRDFNCDGKKDIFSYSALGGSMAVYKNTSTESGGISFELEIESLLSFYEFNSNQFTANLYVSSQDIPAIFDFEGDGDLDLLTFSVGGGMVELHINNSVEVDGFCHMNDMALRNRCYGGFIEGTENNGITTDDVLVNQACSFNVVDPMRDELIQGGARHIGSTILAFDATQDGLPEIMLGDITYTNMTYLENNDQPGDLLDSIGYVSTSFPSDFGTAAIHIDNFPAGFYEDIDGDGVKDLIVGVNNPYASDNKKSVWYYENMGQTDLPLFSLVQRDFLQDETIDYGEASAPVTFDYNNDGLLDLVVGSRGEYLGDGLFKPTLSLYINEGTENQPVFKLVDGDWLELSEQGLGQFVHPTFGDIDGDLDLDLLVGDHSGIVSFFENTAGPNSEAVYVLQGEIEANGEMIDVGQSSAPTLFDLNDDGLLDLIIGERNGNLTYFSNTGTAANYTFNHVTDTLGGITGIEPQMFVGNTNANFFVLDGELHLAVGLEGGRVFTYNNITGNLDGDFTLITDNAFGIDVGLRCKPWIVDIDNDDKFDVFVGSVGGGVNLFSSDLTVSVEQMKPENQIIELFPNPAQDQIQVRVPSQLIANAPYRIISITGKTVSSGVLSGNSISLAAIPSGIFILEIESKSGLIHGKFIKK